MPNSPDTTGNALPSIEESIWKLRKAWGTGVPAEPEVIGPILMRIEPTPEGRELLKELFRSKTSRAGPKKDPAGEQKQLALSKAMGPVMQPLVSQMAEECGAFASGTSLSPEDSRKSITRSKEFLAFCRKEYSLMGITSLAGFDAPIRFAEFVLKMGKPPHAAFLSGVRANSRIFSLLKNAGANEDNLSWAGEYLRTCIEKNTFQEKRAEAIARVVYVSRSGKAKSGIHPLAKEMVWGLASGLASQENEIFHSIMQVKLRSLCSKEAKKDKSLARLADEFRKNVEEAVSSRSGKTVVLEETLLLEPTTWARKIESGEPMPISGISFGFFAGKPPHQLANAALVIANSNAATEESKVARGVIATKILLSIGGDSLLLGSEGKKVLRIHTDQETLFAAIRPVLENPEIKSEILEYALSPDADSQHSEIRARLLKFYEPDKDAQEDAPKEAEPEAASPAKQYLQENSNLLPFIGEIAFEGHPHQNRFGSFLGLSSALSKGEGHASRQDAVLAIAAFALNGEPEVAETATKALLSLDYVSGHGWSQSDSFLAIANVAEVSPEISNRPLAEKLMGGSDAEAESAIFSLALRAGKSGNTKDGLGRVIPSHILAAREIVDSFEPSLAARTLIKLSNRHFPGTLLLDSLESLRSISNESVQSEIFQAIESDRARRKGALFAVAGEALERAGTFESKLSEQFLFALGGSLENRAESIAKGALMLGGPDAYRFFIQKLGDATAPEELQLWAEELKLLPGTSTDSLLIEAYDALPQASRPFALEALRSREPSMEKAEFFFEICDSGESETSAISASALMEMDFQGADAERKFELLFRMRNGRSKSLNEHAANTLPEFLRENHDAFTKDSLDNLLNLFIDEQSKEVSEEVREILLSKPHQLLTQMGIGGSIEERIAALYSGDGTVATLATFALAKEMASEATTSFSPLNARVNDAVKDFSREGNQLPQLRLALAAYASRSPRYISSVLIPFLGSEEGISSTVANSLLDLGQLGFEAAERAASREGLPPHISKEMAQRISTKAMKLLFEAGEYSQLATFLGHNEDWVKLSAYSFFESAKPGAERDEALLKALESDSINLKIAALSLLPREKKHLGIALSAVSETSEEVSSLAADFAASLLEPEELIALLAEETRSEFIRQKIADAYCEQNPGFSKYLADSLGARENPLQETRKKAILAIRFFQDMDSLYALYRTTGELGTEAQELASDSLVYFCEALSGSVVERGSPTRERMFLFLEAYNLSEDGRIRETAKAIARNVNSGVLLEAALCSKDPEILFSATNLFLSVSNEEYAAKAAIAFREIAKEGMHSFAEPFQEILFGRDYDAFKSLASPLESPSADPLPYRLVKEVAIQEFINGKGAPGSDGLLLAFVDQFGDFEGVFDHGLVSISELAWAARDEPGSRQISAKLSSMAPADAADKARLLLRVLLENDYTILPEIQKDEELSALVCEHALRRLVESFSGSSSPDANCSNIERGLRLAAELLEQGALPETPVQGLRHPSSPVVASLTNGAGIPEQDFLFGIELLEEMRTDIKDVSALRASLLRKRRQEAHIEEGVSPAQARADASRLGRARVVQPVRPVSPPPGKIPRGNGSGQ